MFIICGCVFLILEQAAHNIQKRRKVTLLLLLASGKQALLQARGRVGRLFRTSGVGVDGAFVVLGVALVCGPQLVGLQRS